MSEKINDGGSAFPCRTDYKGESFSYQKFDQISQQQYTVMERSGMTLRAYFTGQALANPAGMAMCGFDKADVRSVALRAVEIADAALLVLFTPPAEPTK